MSPIHIQRYTRPRMLFLALVIGCSILIIAAYALFQARFLIEGPLVTLSGELSNVQHERQITLTGSAHNITAITLNGRAIVTNEQGEFSESLVLENGYTIVRIEARDRFGRTTALERSFVYTPSALSLAQ